MEPAHIKLVTIIAASELKDRLQRDLTRLGVTGYTLSRVEGHGKHGTRARGFLDDGNVRFEAIVGKPVADTILQHVAGEADSDQLVAFAQDIEAVPRTRFESRPRGA